MRIKWLTNSISASMHGDTQYVVNPAYFYIRAYYLLHGLNNKDIVWLDNLWFMGESVNQQVDIIINENPDILCLSFYVWNEDWQRRIIEKVKQFLPNIKIVIGGPQVDAHKDPNFFEKNPLVDFVCYGDGEEAFQLLIDKLGGFLPDDHTLVNMVENLKTGYKKWPYKMLSDEKYWSSSPWLMQKELVKKTFDDLCKMPNITRDLIETSLEFTRGCMYNCSFCDWSQNLTKKVKRRKVNFREEIDFFHEIDIRTKDSDANFGIFKEDLEIYKYACSLTVPERNFSFHPRGSPKLNKEAAYEVFYTMLTCKKFQDARIPIQDTNQDVLANIDRPDASWAINSNLIKKLKESLPKDAPQRIVAEFIVGLPGQTYESVIESTIKMYKAGIRDCYPYYWNYLINSPAAELEYQKKFQIEWHDAYKPIKPVPYTDIKNLYEDFKTNLWDSTKWQKYRTIKKTFSMDWYDIIRAQYFMFLFFGWVQKYKDSPEDDEYIKKIVKTIKIRVERMMDIMIPLTENLNKEHNMAINGVIRDGQILPFFDDVLLFYKL